ncbi:adhesin [Providencia rettgeri]|uniref:Adhesin n=1 Tax=Providencia rettgeri TaxID=587 RepID=A0AAD2VSZ6_PRORE|nr:adhesin [Providencia rettgeri]
MKKISKRSLIVLFLLLIVLFLSLLSYSVSSHAFLGPSRYAPYGGTYTIDIIPANPVVADEPIISSTGEKLYLIAPPNQEGIIVDRNSAQPSGSLECRVNYLQGWWSSGIAAEYAFHRIFPYKPEAGFTIKGLTAYRINNSTFFTLHSEKGLTQGWQNIEALACSGKHSSDTHATSLFTTQFPFELRIYVKELPLNGKIVIPSGMFAGYTRMFQDPGVPDVNVPADLASIRLNLAPATIFYLSNCKANIDNLNINHHQLDSQEFDSKVTSTATYQCERAQSVKVRFSLDYVTDNDPQKRVPLKSGKNTIYSELSLYDPQSNQRGKKIETTIEKIKHIQIESHLSGTNAEPGKYIGSAWLIANYL